MASGFKPWLAKVSLRVLSYLPLRGAQWLAHPLGGLASIIPNRESKICKRNLELVFPDMSPPARKYLHRQVMIETMACLLETPRVWRLSPDEIKTLAIEVKGLDAVQACTNGVILLIPHRGSWEFLGLWLSFYFDTVILYRASNMPEIDATVTAARSQYGSTLVPNNQRGVIAMMRHLRNGNMTCLLPDHDPGDNSGSAFIPFYGIPARTSTLPVKLAQKTEAPVFFASAIRKPNGYAIEFVRGETGLYDADTEAALTVMNRQIEDMASICPEQYVWTYRRYKTRPVGEGKLY
jgi:Kdo2-lipid IVA lauroyltransferase/acyltransferase